MLPTLPLAPDLDTLEAMDPAEGQAPFTHGAWLFEMPLFGHRALAQFGEGACRLHSRHHIDISDWFPETVQALAAWRCGRTVVDGELCVLDAIGRNDRARLHERALSRGPRPGLAPVVFVVSDLLVVQGLDVRGLPLTQRRQWLQTLPFAAQASEGLRAEGPVRLKNMVMTEGSWLARQAQLLGHSQIYARRKMAPYSGGPSFDWLRLPCSDLGVGA